MQTPKIPVEDRPWVVGTVLSSAILLAMVAQYLWGTPLLNLMAALMPVLYLVATVAARSTLEDAYYDEEMHERQDNLRYAITILAAAYVSVFMALALPREWIWAPMLILATPTAFILIVIADRWMKKRQERHERNLLDEPFPLDEAAMDKFVESGAIASHFALLIEPQRPRR